MPARKASVLIVGSAAIDEIVMDLNRHFKFGGVPAYAGLVFRKHGINTLVAANISDSDKALFRFFKSHNIHLLNGTTQYTTKFINQYFQQERRQKVLSSASPILFSTFSKIVDQVDHIHLGPLFPNDISLEIFDQPFPKANITCDIQGYVRQIDGGQVRAKVSDRIEKVLNFVDVIKGDVLELQLICDALNATIPQLLKKYNLREIVVTNGISGGAIYTLKEKYDYEPPKVITNADATGAGDIFFAAYIVSHFFKRQDVQESSRYAAEIVIDYLRNSLFPQAFLYADDALFQGENK